MWKQEKNIFECNLCTASLLATTRLLVRLVPRLHDGVAYPHSATLIFSLVRKKEGKTWRQPRRYSNLSWLANLLLPALCILPPMGRDAVLRLGKVDGWRTRIHQAVLEVDQAHLPTDTQWCHDRTKNGVRLGGARMCPPHPRHQLRTLRHRCDWRAPSELRDSAALTDFPPCPESGAYSALVTH